MSIREVDGSELIQVTTDDLYSALIPDFAFAKALKSITRQVIGVCILTLIILISTVLLFFWTTFYTAGVMSCIFGGIMICCVALLCVAFTSFEGAIAGVIGLGILIPTGLHIGNIAMGLPYGGHGNVFKFIAFVIMVISSGFICFACICDLYEVFSYTHKVISKGIDIHDLCDDNVEHKITISGLNYTIPSTVLCNVKNIIAAGKYGVIDKLYVYAITSTNEASRIRSVSELAIFIENIDNKKYLIGFYPCSVGSPDDKIKLLKQMKSLSTTRDV